MTATDHEDLSRAELLVEVGRWGEATDVLARVLASRPGSVRALCLLAYCQAGLGDDAAMLDTAQRAVAAGPTSEWAYRLLAAAWRRVGDNAQAVAAAREAVRIAPDTWETHVGLAAALLRAGDPPAALAAAQEARRLEPAEAQPHTAYAAAADRLGRLDDAEAALRQALAVAPDDPTAHNYLGLLHLRRGRLLRALRSFATAGGRDPGWEAPSLNTGFALGSLGWQLCLAAGMLVGATSFVGLAGPQVQVVAGTVVLAAYAGVVAWVLRLLPPGLRTQAVHAAPRRVSTWVAGALVALSVAQVYLLTPAFWGMCLSALAIVGVSLHLGARYRPG